MPRPASKSRQGAPPPADPPTSGAGAPPPADPPLILLAPLVVALFWAIEGIDVNAPQLERVVILLSALALAWAALREVPHAVGLTAYLAVLVAVSERMRRTPLEHGSDVLRATVESIRVVASGGNPYTHVLTSTDPVGSPFVYPPGELAWYAVPLQLFGDITRVDSWAGIAIVAAIALLGLRVGFGAVALPAMLYASWGTAGYRAIDGQNDVSASALVVFALVALAFALHQRVHEGEPRWTLTRGAVFVLSAALFGWAMAFKQYSVLVLPPVLRWIAVSGGAWRRYAAIALGVAAAFVLPFFVMDPGAFVRSQLAALTFHQEVWGTNLLNTIAQHADPSPYVGLFFFLEVTITLGLAYVLGLVWRPSSLGAAVLAGAGAVLVPLLLARWTTQPYYAYAGAIVACGLALLSPGGAAPFSATVSSGGAGAPLDDVRRPTS